MTHPVNTRRGAGAALRWGLLTASLLAATLAPASLRAQVAAMPAPQWTDSATSFVQALRDARFEAAAARVASSVPVGALSAERLQQIWAQLTGQLGALGAIMPLDEAESQGRHVVNLSAQFARSEMTLRVVFDAGGGVSGFWVGAPRPPAYEPPAYVDTSTFDERTLQIGAEPALGATLTLPRTGQPVPLVVLVHGSGPQDRDESIAASRPFRDLAWGLATRGVAVLRYDKRTWAHPSQLGDSVTVEQEVVLDALAALDTARTAAGVDPSRVVLLGHSLGGTLAPEIAVRDAQVAGVVLMAGAARPFGDVLAEQLAYIDSLAGAAGQPTAELDSLRAMVAQLQRRTLPPDADALGAPARYFYDLTDRRPVERAGELRVPVLVLQGGRDYQVTSADVAAWRAAIDSSRLTVREFPSLNHLFVEGIGKATPAEYSTSSGHVAESVVNTIARWVRALP